MENTGAYHEWDTYVLFGFIEVPYTPSEDDIALMVNIRNVYKEFIHSARSFNRKFNDKTIVLWNNTISVTSQYHEMECKFWNDNGFSTHYLGNLGV